jgi:dolichol-phosphate mannosyltransferase
MFAQGLATTCILMLFLGGVQLMSMGVLGAYIGRIYDEAKRRPKFIVEESLGLSESAPRLGQAGPQDGRDF